MAMSSSASCEPAKMKFFLPKASGLMVFSTMLLSISAFHWSLRSAGCLSGQRFFQPQGMPLVVRQPLFARYGLNGIE